MIEEILASLKQLLGLPEDDTSFDPELLIFIGDALASLKALGVIASGIDISSISSATLWSDLEIAPDLISHSKTYCYISVKLVFDPPSNGHFKEILTERLTKLSHIFSLLEDYTPPEPVIEEE